MSLALFIFAQVASPDLTIAPKDWALAKKQSGPVNYYSVVTETGSSGGTWKNEDVDLKAEYRKHFEGGDQKASVPSFVGIGLMSDGDQTQSTSAADWGTFTITK